MSLVALFGAGKGAGHKGRTDAASDSPFAMRESASELARRLVSTCRVIDCETTGFGGAARLYNLAAWDLCGTPNLTDMFFNPGLLYPNGGSCDWDATAFQLAAAAIKESQDPPSELTEIDPVLWLSYFPAFADQADCVIDLLVDRSVCAWSVKEFDRRVLQQEFARVCFAKYSQRFQIIRWYDAEGLYLRWRAEHGRTVKLESGKDAHTIALATACRDEGIAPETTHRAITGVRCVCALLKRMAGISEVEAPPIREGQSSEQEPS